MVVALLCFLLASGEQLSLEQAVEHALSHSETVGIAAQRSEAAAARRWQTIGQYLPALQANGTVSEVATASRSFADGTSDSVDPRTATRVSASARWQVFDPTMFTTLATAGRDRESEELSARGMRRALTFRVARHFLDALYYERLVEAAGKHVASATAARDDARERETAGIGRPGDVLRAELAVASARVEVRRAEGNGEQARLGLCLALGSAPADLCRRPLATPPPLLAGSLATAKRVERALAQRSDFAVAGLSLESARAAVVGAWLRLVPRLGVTASILRSTGQVDFIEQATTWEASVNLNWDLFDGGIREARALEASALAEQAGLELQQLRRTIDMEVRLAEGQLQLWAATVAEVTKRAELAGQNAEEVRQRYAQGLASSLEHIDAVDELFTAEVQLLHVGLQQMMAELAILDAIGAWPIAGAE